MSGLTITLPYPISANKYWRPVPVNGRSMIVPTKEAKAYKQEVMWLFRAAGVRSPCPGRVQIHIDIYPQRPKDWQTRMRKLGPAWDETVQCIDIDNARKVLYDAFKGVAIVDDKWVFADSARRCVPDGDARVVVTITPISMPKPDAALQAKRTSSSQVPEISSSLSLFDPLEV